MHIAPRRGQIALTLILVTLPAIAGCGSSHSGGGDTPEPDASSPAAVGGGGAGGRGGTGGGGGGGGGAGGATADAGRTDGPPAAPPGKHWVTNKYDNARTAWNPNETVLTPDLLAQPDKFGRLFSRPVDGQIYAQPLVMSGVMIAGKPHDVVFVVTQTNNAYAFDADDKSDMAMPLWMINFGKPLTPMDVNACCTDIAPLIGITSTPVLDPTTGTIYIVSKTNENGMFANKLHAIDVASGMEKFGGPVTIGGSVKGNAIGSMAGTLNFDGRIHMNRPGLLLQGGTVYIGFASHTDSNNYHGWVFGYDAATLKPAGVFVTAPDKGRGAGIWQSGSGLVGDGTSIYFSTGNGFSGASDPNTTPPQLGEAMVKLDNKLQLQDWHIRGAYVQLDNGDADYGSAGPMLIPKVDELIMAGKDTAALLYDKNNLGKYKPMDEDAVVQKFTGMGAQTLRGVHSGGWSYFEGDNGPTIFAWPSGSRLLGFKVLPTKKIDPTPIVVGPDSARTGIGSGIMTISSNGAKNGILWTTIPEGDVGHDARPGTLRAYSPIDGKLLWRSDTNKMRDDIGFHAKESPPTVINGKVFVASWNGTTVNGTVPSNSKAMLMVYGPLP